MNILTRIFQVTVAGIRGMIAWYLMRQPVDPEPTQGFPRTGPNPAAMDPGTLSQDDVGGEAVDADLQERRWAFRPVRPEVEFSEDSEIDIEVGQQSRNIRTLARAVTASGELTSPRHLKVLCQVCGGMDTGPVLRCWWCARSLCKSHAKQVDGGGREVVVCDQHLLELLENSDLWETGGVVPQWHAYQDEPERPIPGGMEGFPIDNHETTRHQTG